MNDGGAHIAAVAVVTLFAAVCGCGSGSSAKPSVGSGGAGAGGGGGVASAGGGSGGAGDSPSGSGGAPAGAGGSPAGGGGSPSGAGGSLKGLGGAPAGFGGSPARPRSLPAITGFTTLNQLDVGGLVRCDPTGTCFKAANYLYRMAPGGTRFDFAFPDPMASSPGAKLPAAGLAFDRAGNFYTAAATDLYKIAPGATLGTYLGTMGALGTGYVANGPSLVIDDGGNFYLSETYAHGLPTLVWLPAGEVVWQSVDAVNDQGVYDTAVYGDAVYFAGTDRALVFKPGATALATVADSPAQPNSLVVDSQGGLLGYFFQTVGKRPAIFRLPAGGIHWMETSALILSVGDGTQATNLVMDEQDNAYIVASDATTPPRSASLFELPAGSLTWSKLADVSGLIAGEPCGPKGSLANDHVGHLILQCLTTLSRSLP